jgi:hypothetical protein
MGFLLVRKPRYLICIHILWQQQPSTQAHHLKFSFFLLPATSRAILQRSLHCVTTLEKTFLYALESLCVSQTPVTDRRWVFWTILKDSATVSVTSKSSPSPWTCLGLQTGRGAEDRQALLSSSNSFVCSRLWDHMKFPLPFHPLVFLSI